MVLHALAETPVQIAVTLRHINRVRKAWGLNRGKGRPRRAGAQKKSASQGKLLPVVPRLSFVGGQVFAHGLDQQHAFDPVVAQLTPAIQASKQTHPGDDCALVHHRERTLVRRFQALLFAPLWGIDRLSACDTHEHPLETLRGRGYHRATLRQFLGPLERVGAAEAVMPTRVPEQVGPIISVDGHMIASWSRRPMHKGTITMLGRIMAGLQAVMAHDAAGPAVFVASHPPDIHVSRIMVAYCQQVAEATGSTRCVIDRAVNAGALAGAFDAQGLGVLCMLDDNEHAGVESFEATVMDTLEDGTKVESGPWKARRPDDPRHCVIVAPAEGKTLVYWGIPPVQKTLEPTAWPRVYRERNEMQELSFKRMHDHGALKTNYGRKTMLGPDRHQQRKREKLAQSLEVTQQRVDKQTAALTAPQEKVAESASTGHGTRLAQRQQALVVVEKARTDAQHDHAPLLEQAGAIGPPQERADRDFRTQTIMTMRTLRLENALMACMVALCAHLPRKVRLDCIVRILFERSGARMDTVSQVIYGLNTAGVSRPYRRRLAEVVEGLCAMELRDQGKPMRVYLKDMPP